MFDLVNEENLKIKIPSAFLVSGASGSGKTHFVLRLLENADTLFSPPPREIRYHYGEFGNHVLHLQSLGIPTFAGMPEDEALESCSRPFILVCDDLMLNADSKQLSALFTKQAHHKQFCIVFLVQNLFEKNLRVPRGNCQYFALLSNPNSALQVRTLASQIFVGKVSQFLEAYNECTREPFSYLFLDLHPSTPHHLRIRTQIFPGETQKVFLL